MRREIRGELGQGRCGSANSPLRAETRSPAPGEAMGPLPNARQPGLPDIAGKWCHRRVVGTMVSTAPGASRSTKLLARVETRRSWSSPLHSDFSNSSSSC